LTSRFHPTKLAPVFTLKPDRPYFEAWLRRTKRQFAESGRLTQTATLLAAEGDSTAEEWSIRLRTMMDGREMPSIEVLTRIDALLSGPAKSTYETESQLSLF
jgi:hypothetical protein